MRLGAIKGKLEIHEKVRNTNLSVWGVSQQWVQIQIQIRNTNTNTNLSVWWVSQQWVGPRPPGPPWVGMTASIRHLKHHIFFIFYLFFIFILSSLFLDILISDISSRAKSEIRDMKYDAMWNPLVCNEKHETWEMYHVKYLDRSVKIVFMSLWIPSHLLSLFWKLPLFPFHDILTAFHMYWHLSPQYCFTSEVCNRSPLNSHLLVKKLND